MCNHCPGLTIENILADALVRLVMVADGVSEEEMRIVLESARDALSARDGAPRNQRRSGTDFVGDVGRRRA